MGYICTKTSDELNIRALMGLLTGTVSNEWYRLDSVRVASIEKSDTIHEVNSRSFWRSSHRSRTAEQCAKTIRMDQ